MIDGYLADIPYPPHFPQAFAPPWIDHALRVNEYRPPRAARGAFRYLDLGCGNALQLVAMALAHPEGHFIGTDADPHGLEHAASLARHYGIDNLELHAETFAETRARGIAPVDYIAVLGILSWVSPANRALVWQIAGETLRPGGVLSVGYNAMPGRAQDIPLQRLILEQVRDTDLPLAGAVGKAMAYAAELRTSGALAFQTERARILLEELRLDPDFLPHEYLSEHWEPFGIAEIARTAAQHDLAFAGSLELLHNRHDLMLSKAQRALFEQQSTLAGKLQVVDLIYNRSFRRDMYVRDPEPIDTRALRDQAWVAATLPVDEAEMSFRLPSGRVSFDKPTARAIVSGLQDGPRPLGEIDVPGTSADRRNLLDLLMVANLVLPVDPPAAIDASAFNQDILELVRTERPAMNAQVSRFGAFHIPESVITRMAGGTQDPKTYTRLGLA